VSRWMTADQSRYVLTPLWTGFAEALMRVEDLRRALQGPPSAAHLFLTQLREAEHVLKLRQALFSHEGLKTAVVFGPSRFFWPLDALPTETAWDEVLGVWFAANPERAAQRDRLRAEREAKQKAALAAMTGTDTNA
jgi:hypothetical protein